MRNYKGPGRYRHFKGGLYDVIGLASFPSEDGSVESCVVYRPVDGQIKGEGLEVAGQTHYLRTLRSFNAMVPREHGEVRRFVKESDLPTERSLLCLDIVLVLERYVGPETAKQMQQWEPDQFTVWATNVANKVIDEVLS